MKKPITPRNDKDQAHGLWIFYYNNGDLMFKGHLINSIRYGYWNENYSMTEGERMFKA